MITPKNYYQLLPGIDRSKFTEDLKEGAAFVDDATRNGTDWTDYEQDAAIREVIDTYFRDLDKLVNAGKKPPTRATKEPESEIIDNYGKTEEKKKTQKTRTQKPTPKLKVVKRAAERVERISDDIMFIDRFVSMHGKIKTKNSIRLFIKRLQDAIAEKRLRASSQYADELNYIQDSLLSIFHEFKGDQPILIDIAPSRRNKLLAIAGKQERMLSVRLIKSYISLQGKRISNDQASRLYNRIGKSIDQEQVSTNDPYRKAVEEISLSLMTFIKKNRGEGVLTIPARELNGLQGIVGEMSGLSGIEAAPKNIRMNSMDFIQLEFEKIGFKGKWLDFFGDPSPGFSVLVTAPAKYGKSILCTDFAGYLARNHGSVLYVAKEEGLDDTLKRKLIEVAHPNLTVQDYFDGDVSGFDFVFLDSITRLGLSPEDLNELREANPDVSFIFISQVTKAGKARGSNEFYHDVDAIVEFPQIGHAVQYGRFNQGGEMNVF